MKDCNRCGGTGRIITETHHAPRPGSLIGEISSLTTALCACRTSLPPREGRASWWSLRSVYSETVDIPIGREFVEVSVDTEVPISEEDYPVVTKGNRYYPTLVSLGIGRESLTLHGDTARELAQRLIEAADAVDRCDLPDTDTCGHWSPCDCGKAATA